MQEDKVNMANDSIAIICEKNDNRNNTYTIIPIEAALGKKTKDGMFISENGQYKLYSIEDPRHFSDDQSYIFLDTIENVRDKYKEIDNLSIIMYYYLKDIASKMIIALKSEDRIYIYTTKYEDISPEIDGDVKKKYSVSKDSSTPEIIVPQINEELIIDAIGLENYLKERILENDDILEDIVTTIAMNYRATNSLDVEPILSIGPTGSGKTATFKAIAEYLGVPLTIYDCNSLSSVGYVGKDLDDVMREVYYSSGRDIRKAEKSILIFDEIDKLAIRGNDVKDAAVQYALLKLLDGYRYTFELTKNGPQISIDSSFMTVGALGAFPEMFLKKEREGNLGFNSDTKKTEITITTDDLVKFGMLAELIGRLDNTYIYKKLDKDGLKNILLESKNSPLLRKIERYKNEFNTEIVYEDAFIDAIVEEAYKKKVGGRSLSKLIAYAFKKTDRALTRELQLGKIQTPRKLVLTQNTVYNNQDFKL